MQIKHGKIVFCLKIYCAMDVYQKIIKNLHMNIFLNYRMKNSHNKYIVFVNLIQNVDK